mmetsp:Transcript_28189/g.43384  ORF Transcript_28189/g.43384 Transcript_28189/m.43384 type:complete len:89 (-) Transcript_28189:234-500(-)|eukprot:CAMPEP_0118684364 /NCGR_PEP_ID=MMETSP0800-20121206/6602_1 /TAXON_ID=210618 ORGANISM="Striatella unipunctata, Strain CCMP2910" /NCGR_SAMPLE_ID=MMETSP0800 /ASSEMBLY_ACC=CAM_ASM_000638 /LENGTH=88 /DNA_ID=CAMNT_0006581061 /DNA_START=140 /DNA_END=406 /DNA_ORIENTATION=-
MSSSRLLKELEERKTKILSNIEELWSLYHQATSNAEKGIYKESLKMEQALLDKVTRQELDAKPITLEDDDAGGVELVYSGENKTSEMT